MKYRIYILSVINFVILSLTSFWLQTFLFPIVSYSFLFQMHFSFPVPLSLSSSASTSPPASSAAPASLPR